MAVAMRHGYQGLGKYKKEVESSPNHFDNIWISQSNYQYTWSFGQLGISAEISSNAEKLSIGMAETVGCDAIIKTS